MKNDVLSPPTVKNCGSSSPSAPARPRSMIVPPVAHDILQMDGNEVVAIFSGLLVPEADCVPDLVDEFDDGALAPNWQLAVGTAEETGGALHLKNPGAHVDVGYTVDVSEVASATP